MDVHGSATSNDAKVANHGTITGSQTPRVRLWSEKDTQKKIEFDGNKQKIVMVNEVGKVFTLHVGKGSNDRRLAQLSTLTNPGSTEIHLDDLISAVERQNELTSAARRMKQAIIALAVLVGLLFVINFGSTMLSLELAKDQHVNDQTIKDRDGNVLRVGLVDMTVGDNGNLKKRDERGNDVDVKAVPHGLQVLGLRQVNETRRLAYDASTETCSFTLGSSECSSMVKSHSNGVQAFTTQLPAECCRSCKSSTVTVTVEETCGDGSCAYGTAAGWIEWKMWKVNVGDSTCHVQGTKNTEGRRLAVSMSERRTYSDGPMEHVRPGAVERSLSGDMNARRLAKCTL